MVAFFPVSVLQSGAERLSATDAIVTVDPTTLETKNSTIGALANTLSGSQSPSLYEQDSDIDDTAAFRAALLAASQAGGGTVLVPAGNYTISGILTFYSNVSLIGAASRPTITLAAGARFRFCTIGGLNNIRIANLTIDGNYQNLTGSDDATIVINAASYNVDIEDCIFRNLSGGSTGAIVLSGAAYNCRVANNRLSQTKILAIGLSSAFNCRIEGNWIDTTTTSFGIRLGEGAYQNTIANNKTIATAIEGIGLTYSCYENQIIGNHCQTAGDNGISVSGYRNVISGNICRRNAKAGIGVWGAFNTITGNSCVANNTSDTTTWAGIWISAGFGGTGQSNSIAWNFCDDDQVTPTQYGGIRIEVGPASGAYTVWSAGASVTAGDYRYYGLNIYQAAGSGTTGATPPTHTTGSVSDGTVTWAYINSYITAAYTDGNRVDRSNVVLRSKSGALAVYDNLSWKRNTYPLVDILVASGSLSGTSFTADNSTICKKYERIEIIINGFSHSGASTANIRIELSGDNGSNWSGATTVSATVDAATLIGLHLFIDNTASSTGVRLTTTTGGTGNTNQHVNAFGNTINTGYINAVRISNSQGYTMDAGTYTVLGFGPIL
jgi:hypothetical protein